MKKYKFKDQPKQGIYPHDSEPAINVVVINKEKNTYSFLIFLN